MLMLTTVTNDVIKNYLVEPKVSITKPVCLMIWVHEINIWNANLKNGYTPDHIACLHTWAAILEI